MTTLNEMIEVIKAENPNGLKRGDDEAGYTDLSAEEYEAQVSEWAQGRLDKLARQAEAEAALVAKTEAIEKLAALGIEPKVLGL